MVDLNNKDIFDSIKRMVESENNASVLELTDMVTSDGKVIKVTKGETEDQYDQQGETDVGTFLKLMQNNDMDNIPAESPRTTPIENNENNRDIRPGETISTTEKKNSQTESVINRSPRMTTNNDKNVSNLTKHFDDATKATSNNDYIRRIVQSYVKNYLELTLPALVKKTVEEEVKNMLKNMM